jgi:hypothetical protein
MSEVREFIPSDHPDKIEEHYCRKHVLRIHVVRHEYDAHALGRILRAKDAKNSKERTTCTSRGSPPGRHDMALSEHSGGYMLSVAGQKPSGKVERRHVIYIASECLGVANSREKVPSSVHVDTEVHWASVDKHRCEKRVDAAVRRNVPKLSPKSWCDEFGEMDRAVGRDQAASQLRHRIQFIPGTGHNFAGRWWCTSSWLPSGNVVLQSLRGKLPFCFQYCEGSIYGERCEESEGCWSQEIHRMVEPRWLLPAMLIASSIFFVLFGILFQFFGLLVVPRLYDLVSLEATKIPGFAL